MWYLWVPQTKMERIYRWGKISALYLLYFRTADVEVTDFSWNINISRRRDRFSLLFNLYLKSDHPFWLQFCTDYMCQYCWDHAVYIRTEIHFDAPKCHSFFLLKCTHGMFTNYLTPSCSCFRAWKKGGGTFGRKNMVFLLADGHKQCGNIGWLVLSSEIVEKASISKMHLNVDEAFELCLTLRLL